MISKENYEKLKSNFGKVSSWCIWDMPTYSDTSNTGGRAWIGKADLLKTINTGFVFVGLNCSGSPDNPWWENALDWTNFHSSASRQNDYKLRYAMLGTRYWGSYITDVIKRYPQTDSNETRKYIKSHPEFVRENIVQLEDELSLLGKKPVLVALGGETYSILDQYLGSKYTIVKIKHFSFTISKENYRKELIEALEKY